MSVNYKNPGFSEWKTNNLILDDPVMRRRAGVAVLDQDVEEIFRMNQVQTAQTAQTAGGAIGAPFHMSQYAAAVANPYNTTVAPAWMKPVMVPHKPAAQQTGGMQMAARYYNESQYW